MKGLAMILPVSRLRSLKYIIFESLFFHSFIKHILTFVAPENNYLLSDTGQGFFRIVLPGKTNLGRKGKLKILFCFSSIPGAIISLAQMVINDGISRCLGLGFPQPI